jgi:glycosyltransferase involved in cell wall biosynthesis
MSGDTRAETVLPFLSAAMIVRDEARHLADCLASLHGLADEIVVVDTGSVDNTAAITRAHGARVHDVPWQDDFAAARNAALDRCSGEWILYIDADERVRPAAREHLFRMLADPGFGGCYVRLVAKAGRLPYREMRLFRSDPRIRFTGVIHENIWPALRRYLAATGRGLGETGLVLDHVGYEGDQTRKHARNLPLLLKALEHDPSHTYCWYHLGAIRRALGDPTGARAALQAGIAAARRHAARPAQDSLVFIELAQLELDEGGDPRPVLEELLRYFPDHAHGLWMRAQLNLRDGLTEAAEADFRALHAWPDGPAAREATLGYDRRLFGSLACEGVAACRWRQRDHAGAARWFGRALAAEPDCLEYRVKQQLCARLAETGRAPTAG